MHNELLHIGPLTVYGYGFMIAMGVLAAWFVAEQRARKLKLACEHIFYLVVWCAIGGFTSAKILFWITNWREFLQNPRQIIGSDGFVVYGGIIGGILVGWLYCRIKKLKFLEYFDLMMPYIRMRFDKRLPMEAFHRRAMDYFRQYLIVGGMPQAVAKYVETRDFEKVDEVKRDILALYRNDIHKYADNQETKVVAIFEEIPGQLQKHEKKFFLSALQSEARMRDYSQAFFWLSDAKIINCWYNSTEPSIGLKLNEERTTLKCYMGDTGLLISHAFDEREIVSADLYRKLMFDKLEVNEGMLVENIVAQMLRAAGHRLYFFSNSSRTSADDRMEIDFLIAKPVTTSRHNISPIEVKSGQRYTLNSLRKCIAKYGSQLSTPYVLHDKDVKTEDGIVYLPLYMTPLL